MIDIKKIKNWHKTPSILKLTFPIMSDIYYNEIPSHHFVIKINTQQMRKLLANNVSYFVTVSWDKISVWALTQDYYINFIYSTLYL